MVNLSVREVNFNGDTLIAAQDKATEKVYVAVKWICEGISLTRGQINNEVKKVQEDIVLQKLARNLVLDTGYGFKDVLCIELDGLPLWLAKISITPKMQKDSPETVEKLVSYQLKAKEVLANAFIHNVTQIVPKTYKEALLALVESIEEKEKLEAENKILLPKAKYHDEILKSKSAINIGQIAKDYGLSAVALNKILNEERVQYKQNKQWLLYSEYADKGYVKSHTSTFALENGEIGSSLHTKWTQTGRLFIHDLLRKRGITAIIDREDQLKLG